MEVGYLYAKEEHVRLLYRGEEVMKLKMKIFILILTATALLVLSSCKKEESAKQSFEKYKTSWEKQDFTSMYSMLSSEVKEKVTEQQFVDRYSNIYKGIEANDIVIKPKYPSKLKEDKIGRVRIPFSVAMNTLAGNTDIGGFEAVIKKEKINKKETWTVEWNEMLIFPTMEAGDKVKVIPLTAKRGDILDRNNNLLASNGKIVTIGIEPKRFLPTKTSSIPLMAKILDIQPSFIEDKLKSVTNPDWLLPIINLSSTDTDKIAALMKLTGVVQQKIEGRIYPGGEAFGSLIGYVAPVTAEELKNLKGEGYNSQSRLGKAGLEQVYEKRLRGEDGGEIYISRERDGREVQRISIVKKDPKNGENITLAVDFDLQTRLYEEMKKDAGASAAINPKTGEILALVSSPSYDSNIFSTYNSETQKAALSSNPKDPFLNRFKKAYVPGSTFKFITAAMGLKQGVFKPQDTMDIIGKEWQPNGSWGGYKITRLTDPGRPVNMFDAFMYSDNIYFAKIALDIGSANFINESKRFGIGEQLPIDYPIEKSQIANNNAINGETLLGSSGFGQGEVLMSPLHVGLTYSTMVNNGDIISPILELKKDGLEVKMWKEKVISPDNVKVLLEALTEVVENPKGTGYEPRINGLFLAGKTGTAELKKNLEDKTAEENGWFVAFNTDNPRLLVSMVIEDVKTRGGSHYVVPKVKKVMEGYLIK